MADLSMDLDNPVVKLCVAGTQAEFRGQIDEARALYQQAWEYDLAAELGVRHQRIGGLGV